MYSFFSESMGLFLLWASSGSWLLIDLVWGGRFRRYNVDCVGAVMLINRKAAILIDLRPREVWEQAHIERSVCLELDALRNWKPDVKKLILRRKGTRSVILLGSRTRCRLAARVLEAHGVDEVKILEGGLSAWASAQLPVVHA